MSHELRTPLNAIAGYVELLTMGIRGPLTDAQREDLRRIDQNQSVLLALINDALNFAKLEAGHIEFELSDVLLDESLGAMEAFVMPQLRARSLRYDYMPVDPALTVYADREKLQQIVLNLLTNAIKFTPPNGTIRLSVTDGVDSVSIHVHDTGRGIAAEKLEHIFVPLAEILNRAPSTRTPCRIPVVDVDR